MRSFVCLISYYAKLSIPVWKQDEYSYNSITFLYEADVDVVSAVWFRNHLDTRYNSLKHILLLKIDFLPLPSKTIFSAWYHQVEIDD